MLMVSHCAVTLYFSSKTVINSSNWYFDWWVFRTDLDAVRDATLLIPSGHLFDIVGTVLCNVFC